MGASTLPTARMTIARMAAWAVSAGCLLPACVADDRDGFVSIFNGRDLEGWIDESAPPRKPGVEPRKAWSVEDGEIVCAGGGFGFLRYGGKDFADFTLRLEFQMVKKGNSGIGIRTRPFDAVEGSHTRPSFHSYEIQLLDDAGKPPSPGSTGSLYRYVAPAKNPVKPAGEWNSMEITCSGPVIRIALNGVPIQDFDQTTRADTREKPLKGSICLQNHGSPVRFRNIRVRDDGPGGSSTGR